MTAKASVVITTKNRRDELRAAMLSVLDQTLPVELLIFDDGSTDGTSAMVRAEFPADRYPQVRVERVESSLGIIRARNAAIAMATAPIVFTIDDDCLLPARDTLETTLAAFDDPRIAVVTVPIIDVKKSPDKVGYVAPDRVTSYITNSFGGGCNALRRNVFLRVGSYRGYLYRQGEETDMAIRMLNEGTFVRLGVAEPMHHLESPVRDRSRIVYYVARNHILFCWYNVPWPYLPLHMAASSVNVLRHGIREGYSWNALKGLAAGYGAAWHEFRRRRAVSRKAYRAYRLLGHRPLPWKDVSRLGLPQAPTDLPVEEVLAGVAEQ